MQLKYKNYKITTDSLNRTLTKEVLSSATEGKNVGKTVEQTIGYYPTTGNAMKGIIKDMENDNKNTFEMKNYLKEYERIADKLVATRTS